MTCRAHVRFLSLRARTTAVRPRTVHGARKEDRMTAHPPPPAGPSGAAHRETDG
ncbi:hypothetical protein [Streptomyces sp. NPDC126514]|uniref:hypothetical protein n=1 Tax=Streptomyces sp. NPDC126514 TaxID=3155210 RepID=UPI00332750E7